MIQVDPKSQFQTLLIRQTQMRDLNWHRACIPIVLILHSFLNIVYYKSWFFEWDSRQWACYFHVVQQGVVAAWCYLILIQKKRTYLDNQFLLASILYNLFLASCYLYRQYTGDKETSHLIGVGGSIVLCISVILRSGFKHKYFAR